MSIPNVLDISFRFKEVRNMLGLSRAELAEKVLISRSHLANIENGNRDMTVELVCALYENFKVSSDYLLFGKGPMFMNDEEHRLSIHNLSNLEKIEVILQLYHYFARNKDIVYDNEDHDILEYLRKADKDVWMEYLQRIGDKVTVVDRSEKSKNDNLNPQG